MLKDNFPFSDSSSFTIFVLVLLILVGICAKLMAILKTVSCRQVERINEGWSVKISARKCGLVHGWRTVADAIKSKSENV